MRRRRNKLISMNLHDLPIDLAPRSVDRVRSLMRLLALLAIVAGLAALPWSAKAAVSTCTTSSATTFNMGNITVPPNAAVGTLLGSQVQLSVRFDCSNIPGTNNGGNSLYVQAGDLAPRDATDTQSGGIIFATNVPGIGFRVTGSPIQAKSEACLRCGPGSTPGFEIGPVPRNNGRYTEAFTGRFIKTGPVAAGVITSIDLMRFYWYEYGFTPSSGPMSSVLRLNGGTSVSVTGCTVDAGSKNLAVTLPNVRTTDLASIGATAQRTRFDIRLTCQAGVTALMTMTTDNPAAATGVVAPTVGLGYATNVGVQLLDGSLAPIDFDTTRTLGTTPNGAWALAHYAQYYRTASPIGPGAVAATVTFTLTYN